MPKTPHFKRSGTVETGHVLTRLRAAYRKCEPLQLSPGDVARVWHVLSFHDVGRVSLFDAQAGHGYQAIRARKRPNQVTGP